MGLSGFRTLLLTVRATRVSESIGAALVRRLLALDQAFDQGHRTGDLASRVTGDVARVEGEPPLFLPPLLSMHRELAPKDVHT